MRDNRFVDRDYYVRFDSLFYEHLEQWYSPDTHCVRVIENSLSAHQSRDCWELRRSGLWFHVEPKDVSLPPQGWKIHVSSRPERATEVLAIVTDALVPRSVPFKFALDSTICALTLDKRWGRGSSGKFITIYPNSTDQFRELLSVLYMALRNEEGPYILSDRRYRDCRVLYYRYGGFLPVSILTITGEKRPAIMSPAGEPVVDRRLPYFHLPDWVTDPFGESDGGVAPGSPADGRVELNGRYKVERALYFSTAGGVYLADDTRTGAKVVVKEARPYTSVDSFGNDAVSLRQREWQILKSLEDTELVPRPLDLFWEWEHCFLVETYEEGRDLREILLKENPFLRISPSKQDSERYYEIYRQLFRSLLEGLEVLHRRGIVYGDLSANNLVVTNDYGVRFLDLEAAFRMGVDQPTGLYTHGFRDRHRVIRGEQSFEDDLYTVGTLMTYMLFPVNAMANLRRDVYRGLVGRLTRDLGWPREIAVVITDLVDGRTSYDDVRAALRRRSRLRRPQFVCNAADSGWEQITWALGDFILQAMKEDEYQLCPGDPFAFLTNPMSLGFGAIGVLYSLRKCKREVPRKAWVYLDTKLRAVGASDYPPGLLTGLAGIAWGAWELERNEAAVKLMRSANTHPLLKSHHSLFYGMAGVGLANLYFWLRTGKGEFLDCAVDLGNKLMARAREDEKGLFWESDGVVHVGLGYGQSGVALFLLRLSQITEDRRWRVVGRHALNYDLRCGREVEEGVVSYPSTQGDTTLEPYLEEGTAGIVKALLRYGMVREAELLSADLWRKYSISASYLFGLGSLVDALVDLHLFTGDDGYMRLAERPLAGIRDLYLIKAGKGLATPGDGGLAISCDWGTGVAGVMRVLHRYLTKDESDFMLDELDTMRQEERCGNWPDSRTSC